MYNTGPTGGEIVFFILVALISIGILWFVIRTAVHHAVSQALEQYDEHRRQRDQR